MKKQAAKTTLINFELRYPHVVVKSPKYILGGTHCGASSGIVQGDIDGAADGYDVGFLDGEVDGYGD